MMTRKKKMVVKARRSTPMDAQVGARLRTARLEAHKSQTEVAVALGVTFQQQQKYESGTNRLSASRLQIAANFLGKPLAYFFDALADIHGIAAPDSLAIFATRRDSIALAEAFNAIKSPSMRAAIVALAEAAAEKQS